MCLELRKTASRGRSVVPKSRLRTWCCRRCRRTWTSFRWVELLTVVVLSRVRGGRIWPVARPGGACLGRGRRSLRPERLAGLSADGLAFVADALALVRLGGPDLPHLGGELADGLLVGPGDRDVRR